MQVGEVLEVRRQARAQAARLADVDHPAPLVAEPVDARRVGDGPRRGTVGRRVGHPATLRPTPVTRRPAGADDRSGADDLVALDRHRDRRAAGFSPARCSRAVGGAERAAVAPAVDVLFVTLVTVHCEWVHTAVKALNSPAEGWVTTIFWSSRITPRPTGTSAAATSVPPGLSVAPEPSALGTGPRRRPRAARVGGESSRHRRRAGRHRHPRPRRSGAGCAADTPLRAGRCGRVGFEERVGSHRSHAPANDRRTGMVHAVAATRSAIRSQRPWSSSAKGVSELVSGAERLPVQPHRHGHRGRGPGRRRSRPPARRPGARPRGRGTRVPMPRAGRPSPSRSAVSRSCSPTRADTSAWPLEITLSRWSARSSRSCSAVTSRKNTATPSWLGKTRLSTQRPRSG